MLQCIVILYTRLLFTISAYARAFLSTKELIILCMLSFRISSDSDLKSYFCSNNLSTMQNCLDNDSSFVNLVIESSTNQQTTWSLINIINMQTTQICMNTSLTVSSKTTKQIRNFIPHTSANPRFHTPFYFTKPTYIHTFTETNLCILQCILFFRNPNCHMRFSLSGLAYTRAFHETNLLIDLKLFRTVQLFRSDEQLRSHPLLQQRFSRSQI